MKQILFLQLPMLDNDTTGQRENFPFAALWLSHALSQHPEGEFWDVVTAPAEWDELDNAHLIQEILASGVSVAAFTLCLWNAERAARLAGLLKRARPELFLMAGGPEVSEDHPFLLEEPVFDVLITGEGEAVFPEILKGARSGKLPAYDNVLIRTYSEPCSCARSGDRAYTNFLENPHPVGRVPSRGGGSNDSIRLCEETPARQGGWKRGSNPPPQIDLASVQVPVKLLKPCIQARPSVYIETSRGCPLTCTYCRYHHLQKGVRALPAEAAAARVQQLRTAGAKEIRFVDPTFNARADFTQLLELLVKINPDRTLGFFAELRADTLTPEQAELLAQANFLDIEVGVQSTDPQVLRAIRRPANIAKVERGIRLLTGAGVHVTLDLMYGLPKQTLDDVLNSIEWARGLGPNIGIQCMQTLLLPGTDLREQAEQYGMTAMALPPYGVVSTSTLSEPEMRQIETFLHDSDDLPADPVTARFAGYRLSGLFKEQAGRNRRAMVFRGGDLNSRRTEICRQMAEAMSGEPDALWQFVLCPEREEPLELLRAMIKVIQKQPPHLLDRYASAELFGQIASRRIFVRLQKGREYDPVWCEQFEALLGRHFV